MADYKEVIPFIKKWEGGFANNPNDSGGATMSGITLATFRSVYGKDKTVNDLKKMTEEQWDNVFKKYFWDKVKGDDIENQSIADMIVDWNWMSGKNGIKLMQQVVGVTADGSVGPKTIAAINSFEKPCELFNKLYERRKKHFEDIVKNNSKNSVFLKGWMNRLNDIRFKCK